MKNLALNYTKQSRSLFCLVLQQMVSKPGEFYLRLIHKIGKVKMIEFECLLWNKIFPTKATLTFGIFHENYLIFNYSGKCDR